MYAAKFEKKNFFVKIGRVLSHQNNLMKNSQLEFKSSCVKKQFRKKTTNK